MGCYADKNAVFTKLFLLIIILCTLDIASTKYVITNSIGYESNYLIAPLISTPFFILKLLLTILVVFGIRKLCKKEEKLEITSYITITLFYTIVVLNNLIVIFANIDFNLNTQKLFIIFFLLYMLSTPLSAKLSSGMR